MKKSVTKSYTFRSILEQFLSLLSLVGRKLPNGNCIKIDNSCLHISVGGLMVKCNEHIRNPSLEMD